MWRRLRARWESSGCVNCFLATWPSARYTRPSGVNWDTYPTHLCSMKLWSEGLTWPSAPCPDYPEEINLLSYATNSHWITAEAKGDSELWGYIVWAVNKTDKAHDLVKLKISLIFQTWRKRNEVSSQSKGFKRVKINAASFWDLNGCN